MLWNGVLGTDGQHCGTQHVAAMGRRGVTCHSNEESSGLVASELFDHTADTGLGQARSDELEFVDLVQESRHTLPSAAHTYRPGVAWCYGCSRSDFAPDDSHRSHHCRQCLRIRQTGGPSFEYYDSVICEHTDGDQHDHLRPEGWKVRLRRPPSNATAPCTAWRSSQDLRRHEVWRFSATEALAIRTRANQRG